MAPASLSDLFYCLQVEYTVFPSKEADFVDSFKVGSLNA